MRPAHRLRLTTVLASTLAVTALAIAPAVPAARAEELRTVTLRVAADETYRAQAGLAVLLYRAGNYDESWQAVRRAESLGQQIPPDFIQSLEQKAPSH